MPKSMTFETPAEVTKMFFGLTSRWTTPASAPVGVSDVVREVKTLTNLSNDRCEKAERSQLVVLASSDDHLSERNSFEVFEGHVVAALDLTKLKNLADVRMVNLGRNASLVNEHVDELGFVGEVRKNSLDHHKPLKS